MKNSFAALFLITSSVFLLTSSGHIDFADEYMIFFQAESLVLNQSLAVPQAKQHNIWYGREGVDGKPYAGFGPELALLFTPHGNRARFGLKFVGGSYFWFGEGPWGLDLEIAYVLLFDDHIVHEFALETGFAFRF